MHVLAQLDARNVRAGHGRFQSQLGQVDDGVDGHVGRDFFAGLQMALADDAGHRCADHRVGQRDAGDVDHGGGGLDVGARQVDRVLRGVISRLRNVFLLQQRLAVRFILGCHGQARLRFVQHGLLLRQAGAQVGRIQAHEDLPIGHGLAFLQGRFLDDAGNLGLDGGLGHGRQRTGQRQADGQRARIDGGYVALRQFMHGRLGLFLLFARLQFGSLGGLLLRLHHRPAAAGQAQYDEDQHGGAPAPAARGGKGRGGGQGLVFHRFFFRSGAGARRQVSVRTRPVAGRGEFG